MLDWRTITPSNDQKRWVKGCELESCIPPGFLSRFRIVSIRVYDADRNADVRYSVRDAATVTDAEVKAGKLPRSVGEFATLEEALKAIEPFRFKMEEDA